MSHVWTGSQLHTSPCAVCKPQDLSWQPWTDSAWKQAPLGQPYWVGTRSQAVSTPSDLARFSNTVLPVSRGHGVETGKLFLKSQTFEQCMKVKGKRHFCVCLQGTLHVSTYWWGLEKGFPVSCSTRGS